MKILFVFNHPAPYKVEFLNLLSKHHNLDVIFERNKNKDRPNQFYNKNNYQFNEYKIKGVKLGNENFISFGIIKHIKTHQYDLIIMNGYSQIAEILTIRYLKKNKIPYCLYINGGIIKRNESKFKRRLKTRLIEGANFYFSPDEISNKYLTFYGANPNNIYNYSYATIHEDEINHNELNKEETLDLKEKLNINYPEVYISSGQLIKRKNYLSLIKLWKNMPKTRLLLIAGSGKLRKKYETYIRENKENNVVLLGFLSRSQLFEYYKISNAFIFPSREDIYGHVINEALSQGLPIISTCNVNASRHLVKNGYNGFIIDELNDQTLNESIDQILNSNMFQNCVKCASQNTYEKMLDDHLKILAKWEKEK